MTTRLEVLWKETNMFALDEFYRLREAQMYFRSKNYGLAFDFHGLQAVRIRRLRGWLSINENAFEGRIVSMEEELCNSKYHEFNSFLWEVGFDSEAKS